MFDPKLKEALGRVQKPGRYTGGEPGSVYKDKEKVDVRFAFCFPDTYEVGMSFLGEKILYELLNSHENWWCERAFMPWLDMKAEMERLGLPLYTMESKDPLTAFDAVGFTLQYELSYTNILAMLDLARQMKSGLIFTCMAACAMFYNKINVIFLKQYGGDADVGGYGVAWETVEGLSVLVSSALLGKVIFPLLAKSWQQDREAFRRLAGQTARTLWAASLPVIFLICVESDRFLPLIYGPNYASAVTAQRLLTPAWQRLSCIIWRHTP